jgi:hypothetical protein
MKNGRKTNTRTKMIASEIHRIFTKNKTFSEAFFLQYVGVKFCYARLHFLKKKNLKFYESQQKSD